MFLPVQYVLRSSKMGQNFVSGFHSGSCIRTVTSQSALHYPATFPFCFTEPPTKPQVYGEDELYHPDPSYYQPLYPGGLWAKKYYPRAIGSFYSGNVLKDKNGFNIHSDVEILELEKKEQALENAKEEIEREKEEIEDEENEVERKKAIAKQAMVQESRPGDISSVSPDKNTIDYLTEQELRSRAQEKRWAEMYNQFLHPSTWEQSKYNSDSTFEGKRSPSSALGLEI